jgi:2-haloacid dehalogenase
MASGKRTVAIFDLGGVLIDWDPRHLYRKLFDDEVAMEQFLATVCTHEWNRGQDAGRSFAEAARLLKAAHPHHAELIDAYGLRFDEMMAGPIVGSVEILAELRSSRTPLYALSNFSAETFPLALRRFDFLKWFDGMVISGEIGMLKPEPGIYRALLDRFGIDPQAAIFIDDVAVNAAGAEQLGISGIHFTTPAALRADLARLGFL